MDEGEEQVPPAPESAPSGLESDDEKEFEDDNVKTSPTPLKGGQVHFTTGGREGILFSTTYNQLTYNLLTFQFTLKLQLACISTYIHYNLQLACISSYIQLTYITTYNLHALQLACISTYIHYNLQLTYITTYNLHAFHLTYITTYNLHAFHLTYNLHTLQLTTCMHFNLQLGIHINLHSTYIQLTYNLHTTCWPIKAYLFLPDLTWHLLTLV